MDIQEDIQGYENSRICSLKKYEGGERAYGNENNKMFQMLANIKTSRYHVRISMNLDYTVWEKS